MVHKVPASGLSARPYFHRYAGDATDLCDVLSSFAPRGKATRVMGLPGKPDAINRADVDRYFREGRIREIADYCESDVVNTYRVRLRYELFQGELTEAGFEASEDNLAEFIKLRSNAKPHIGEVCACQAVANQWGESDRDDTEREVSRVDTSS
jgi:3'-5' exonuclease